MNKTSGGDVIPAELFQILKDAAAKLLHSICQQIWNTQQWPQDWKRSIFIPIPKKGNAKECSNYFTIAIISYTSKVMLKILQVRLQLYMNQELPDVQAGFRKGRGTRDQIANIRWVIEKAREFQKNIRFCFIDYAKAFDCVHHWKAKWWGNVKFCKTTISISGRQQTHHGDINIGDAVRALGHCIRITGDALKKADGWSSTQT